MAPTRAIEPGQATHPWIAMAPTRPFGNEIVTGVGGRQILAEDPSGNLVELFEPVLPEARLNAARN